MAEKAIFWTTGALGDGTVAYTQAEVIDWVRRTWGEGVHKRYGGGLVVTGAATPVAVADGAAIDYGFPYWNTAAVDVAVVSPDLNTRIDRIVLRAVWATQTVRIYKIDGVEGGGAPAIVTNYGVTWDLKLAQISTTIGGVITVTDERVDVHPYDEVITAMLADGVLSADAAGRLKMATSFFVAATVLSKFGTDSFTNAVLIQLIQDGAFQADAASRALFANSFVDETKLAASVAGNGLTGGAGAALAVGVDNTTIEINADALRVKGLGIAAAQITANTITNAKMADDSINTGQIVAGAVTHAKLAVAERFIKGQVILWSGALGGAGNHFPVDPDTATAVTAWHICNGDVQNGVTTPDLRDRFVVATGPTYAAGTTGGAATHTNPVGTLVVGDSDSGGGVVGGADWLAARHPNHAHPLTGSTGAGSSLPPYYSLVYLCYVGA